MPSKVSTESPAFEEDSLSRDEIFFIFPVLRSSWLFHFSRLIFHRFILPQSQKLQLIFFCVFGRLSLAMSSSIVIFFVFPSLPLSLSLGYIQQANCLPSYLSACVTDQSRTRKRFNRETAITMISNCASGRSHKKNRENRPKSNPNAAQEAH